jgi:tRNA (guanine37-N1)-methyltransferase
MKCDILTLFPQVIGAYLNESILKRARNKGVLKVRVHNIRDFTIDKHRVVDDVPYGGGSGMLLKPEPLFRAIECLKRDREASKVIYLTPQGRIFTQSVAEEFAQEKNPLIFICGRYEGIDERIRIALVDDELSIGDYILTGGELAALVVIDASVRLIPGVLGDEKSKEEESFSHGILEYPQYTRPREYEGLKVPDVLISGNHKKIEQWKKEMSLKKTKERRPDLLSKE